MKDKKNDGGNAALKQENWNLTAPEYYNFATDVVDRLGNEHRNRLAMIWANQAGEEKKFTFHDFAELSNQAANLLLEEGISRGDRVFLLLPRVPEWWIFTLACMKIGAISCPSPVLLTPHDLKYRINFGRFKMVISNQENAPKVDAVFDVCPSLQKMVLVDGERSNWISYQKATAFPTSSLSRRSVLNTLNFRARSKDPMLMIFTSGTSKTPKLVLHTYDYPIGHLITAGLWQGLTEDDLHFTVSDTGWGKNLWGNIFGQWQRGACLFIYDVRGKFHAAELLPVLEKYEITSFCAPPTVYRMLVLHDLTKFDFKCLRSCTAAGEPLHAETCRLWKEGTGITIREAYGQTETAALIGNYVNVEQRIGSMGKAAPNWHIELHDDNGQPVPQGEIGRIAVRIADGERPLGLIAEYVDAPEENKTYFSNGYYYTGDKARIDADGYYWFCGRNDDIIKSSGYRISPLEVEEAVMTHPAVQEVAIVGAPDTLRGKIVKAYIVLKSGYEPSEALVRDIQKHTREETAPYKYPREIEFVAALPKSFSGKIKREVLRQHAERGGNLKVD